MRLGFFRDRLRRSGLLEPPWRSRTTVVLWVSAFMLTCNLYLLATDLSAAVRNLGTSVSAVETALILFPVLTGLGVPAGRRLVDAYGRERAARWALAVFGAGLLITAASPWIGLVVAAYAILGGAAGAVVLAATWSLVDDAPTADSRVAGIALLGIAPLAGTVVGPLIGGFVAEESTWRLGLLLELVIVVLLVAGLRPTEHKAAQREAVGSWLALAIMPVGAAAVLVGVGLAEDHGWWRATRPPAIAPFGLSVVPFVITGGVGLFLVGLSRAAHVRLREFASPPFVGSLAVTLALGTATMGALYALLMYFAIGPRLDSLATGLALAPFGVGATLASLGIFLVRKAAASSLLIGAGIVLSAAGIALAAAGIRWWGGGWGTVPGLFVLGLGNGLALSRTGALTVSTLASNRESEANAINSGSNDLAYALGIAVLGAVFAGVTAHAIVSEVDRQLVASGGAGLPAAARQHAEDRLENDLRTLTPAEQDGYIESQPPRIRAALESAANGAFNDGITAALVTALAGLGLALAALLATEMLGRGG